MHKSILRRRTKIVCTLGPACADVDTLERMIRAGMDIARLNFSHGDYAYHQGLLYNVHRAAERVGKQVGILQDLCGPKIRVGVLPGDKIELKGGQEVTFRPGTWDASWPADVLPVEYEALMRDVEKGSRILFDDGALEAEVTAVGTDSVRLKFIRGGMLKSKKGLNLPGINVSLPSVTPKDFRDLEWGLEHGVDYVALSFVRLASDLEPVRQRLARESDPPHLIAKIEKPEAIEHLEEIVRAADGVMVARGDLGVELAFQKVPLIQKRLITLANDLDKPVITATQMLESMTQNARPTRAEVSDVSNAIMDGTDAVMLSGETAAGKFPVEAVSAMEAIAVETEGYLLQGTHYRAPHKDTPATCLHDALAVGAERIARSLDVKAIVVQTLTGKTALYVSSSRPGVPVLALSSNPRALRRMALYWGITPSSCPPFSKVDQGLLWADDAVKDYMLAHPGDTIVIAVGRQNEKDFSGRVHIHQVGRAGTQASMIQDEAQG